MLRNYVKIAFKVFLRRKFFTFVSLFGTGFTLTVLTVVAALFDHIVTPYPPEVHADRTLKVSSVILARQNEKTEDWSSWSSGAGYNFVERYVRALQTPEKVALLSRPLPTVSYTGDEKVDLRLMRVDWNYWEVLQFEFIEGRPFTAEEERDGEPVAVINAATRQRLFGDEVAVGRTLETLMHRYRVVGVVRNTPEFRPNGYADVWVPALSSPNSTQGISGLIGPFQVLLLAPRPEDLSKVRAEYEAMLAHVDLSGVPEYDHLFSTAETAFEELIDVRDDWGYYFGGRNVELAKLRIVATAIGAILLFMLLPALNMVNLNVSRMLERASEIGVRRAFGAPSRTLVGQFIVENLLLTLVGGLIGLAGAGGVLTLLEQSGLIPYAEFALNYRIFLYGLAASVVFGLLSEVYPAWRMSRLHPVVALRGGLR